MSEKNDGGPAFPCEQHETQEGTWNQTFEPGMSLRDWFAGMALQGLASATDASGAWTGADPTVANQAYRIADAMLAERAK